MAKKNDKTQPNDTDTPGSGDSAANANPNAATDLDQSQANTLEKTLDQQPNTAEDANVVPEHRGEAERTAEQPTNLVPAGSADSTADASADGAHNGTENTHPQSPTHKGELTDAQKKGVKEEMDKPGASAQSVAADYDISPERVFEIIDEINGVPEDERGLNKTGVVDL